MMNWSIFTEEKTVYPAIFRVLLGLILLIDVLFIFPYATEIFQIENFDYTNNQDFISFLRNQIHWFLAGYVVVIVCFIIGFGKNLSSIFMYLFYLLHFLLLAPANNWGTHILLYALLFFVLVNSFQYLAIKPNKLLSENISKVAVISMMLHLLFIYWSNAFHKFNNGIWLDGMALSYIVDYTAHLNLYSEESSKFLSPNLLKLGNYAAMVFQFLFPVLILFKRTRVLIIILGIFFHLSLALTLNIWKFQLIIILLYGFFFTDEEWRNSVLLRIFSNFAFPKK